MAQKYINKLLVIGLLIIVFGCVKTIEDEGSFEVKEEQLMYEILMERDDMKKTIEAAQKVYVWDLLKTFGTYTFFAPTDDAWDKYLQRNDLSSIDEIENETLEAIFEYHILSVEKLTLILQNGMMDESDSTVNGDLLYMDLTKGLDNIMVNNKALITQGNIEAWNGVIHVVDNVLDPPVMNVEEYLMNDDKYSRFYQFLKTNGAADTLSMLKADVYPFDKTEYTVMAIPDDHMDRVEEVVDSLKKVDAKYDEYVAQDPTYAEKYMPNQAKQYAMSFIISGTEYTPNMYSGYKPTLGKVPYGDNTVRMKVKVSDEGIELNNQASLVIENSDLIMKNGVIHECDAPFIFLEKSPRSIIRSASPKERWNTQGKGRVEDKSTVNGYMGDDFVGEVELIPNGAGDRFWIDVPDVPAGFYSLTLITKKQGSLSKIYANDQLMIFPTTDENGIFDFSFLLGNRGRVDNRDPNP
jgi:uncharacterized surface protein with fasciclin (FAS1) repeats